MKNSKNHANFSKLIRQLWAPILLVLVVIPFAWLSIDGTDWLTKLNIRTFISQEPSAWTTAFLGYYAAILSALLGFIAVLLTIYKQEESRREDNRKDALPLIEINKSSSTNAATSVITNGDIINANSNPSNGGLFSLKNVGIREMYDVVLTDIACDLLGDQLQEVKISPIVYKDRSLTIRLQPVFVGNITAHKTIKINKKEFECNTEVPTTFTAAFSYKDCYGNLYKQKIKIEAAITANPLEDKGDKSIVYDTTTIENVEILSAPELIAEGNDKNE